MKPNDEWKAKLGYLPLVLVAVAYLTPFPAQRHINNPNENIRLYATAALVEFHTYEISELRSRWGWTNDGGVRDGRYYSVKAPATTWLGVPAYLVYHRYCQWRQRPPDFTEALWVVRVFGSVLPSLAFLIWFYRWLARRYARLPALVGFFALALGSNYYAYSLLFVSHALAGAAAFASYALLADRKTQGRRHSFVAGFLAASVTAFEYPGFVVSALLSVYALTLFWRRPLALLAFALGALLPTLGVLHMHWVCFGDPLRPGHLFVESDAFRQAHEDGFYGANGIHWDAAWMLLVDRYFGLFAFTPAFALWGMSVFRTGRTHAFAWKLPLAFCVGTYLLVVLMNNWTGGWSVGPRYLGWIMPFLATGAADGTAVVVQRWPRWKSAVIATLWVSVAGSGLAVLFPHPPPAVHLPVRDLYLPLLKHGAVPYGVLHRFGVTGIITLAPLVVVAAGVVWLFLRQVRVRGRMLALLGAAALFLAIHFTARAESDESKFAKESALSSWEPPIR